MIRAIAKGSVLWCFGRLPGGPDLYRFMTRGLMGTQSTHVEKLSHVWPGYVKTWQERAGLDLEGKRLWVHEGGWTPFPFLLGTILTGRGTTVTNEEGRLQDRYMRHALEEAACLDFGREDANRMVRDMLERGVTDAHEVVGRTGGLLKEHIDPKQIDLPDQSADIVHSGGTLEHYPPSKLAAFIGETHRILAPGGIASHVFDHRDHLYHADKRYPFLNHLRYRDSAYGLLCGHRLSYHNRLLPEQVEQLFVAGGFEKIAIRRLMLPSRQYTEDENPPVGALRGLERERLAAKYQTATDLDLCTAAAHYLFRKTGV